MPHLNTMPNGHDQTMSAFIFRYFENEPKIMLHKHKKLNSYMQFGGHIEKEENPWQTIVHEIKEESGYDIKQLKILQPELRIVSLTGAVVHPIPFCKNTHPMPDNHFHSDSSLLFATHEPPKYKPDDGESADIIYLSKDEVNDLKDNEIVENVKEQIIAAYELFIPNWVEIDTAVFDIN